MCRALRQAWPSLSRVRPEWCPEGGEEAARVGGWGLGPGRATAAWAPQPSPHTAFLQRPCGRAGKVRSCTSGANQPQLTSVRMFPDSSRR